MIEKNFKLILQNKRQQLNEDLFLTNSREYQEQIVRLQRELDRVTYND